MSVATRVCPILAANWVAWVAEAFVVEASLLPKAWTFSAEGCTGFGPCRGRGFVAIVDIVVIQTLVQ